SAAERRSRGRSNEQRAEHVATRPRRVRPAQECRDLAANDVLAKLLVVHHLLDAPAPAVGRIEVLELAVEFARGVRLLEGEVAVEFAEFRQESSLQDRRRGPNVRHGDAADRLTRIRGTGLTESDPRTSSNRTTKRQGRAQHLEELLLRNAV